MMMLERPSNGRERRMARVQRWEDMKRKPIHPGEMLRLEFLEPMGKTPIALAAAMRVPVERVKQLIAGELDVTLDLSLDLAIALGTTPEFWMNLQVAHDLWQRRRRREARAT